MEDFVALVDAQDLLMLSFVVLVNERLFDLIAERLLKPLFSLVGELLAKVPAVGPYMPALGQYTLTLLSWATGGLLAWATGINLLACCIRDPWGQVLTCLVAGGGSNLLHSLFGAVEAVKVWARRG